MPRTFGVVTAGLIVAAMNGYANAQQEPPLFDLVEELRITSDESAREKSLTIVSDLSVMPDGRIVLFHGRRISLNNGVRAIRGAGGTATEHVLRIFDASGRFIRMIGRPGDGPGEFRGMGQAGSLGENLWVVDYSNGRETLLALDGRVVAVSDPPTSDVRMLVLGLLPGGRRLVSRRFAPPISDVSAPREGDSVVFSVEDSTGRRIARIATHPINKHRQITARIGGLNWRQDQDLAGTIVAVVSDGAARAVVASDAPLWGGQPGQVRFHIVAPDGNVTQQDISFPARRIPRDYLQTRLANVREPDRSQMLEVLTRELHVPEFFPVLNSRIGWPSPLQAGRDGSIWVSPVYEPGVWRVLIDGRVQMRVRIPAGSQVMEVSRNKVWAVTENADGVPIVIRYAVVPARG